MANGGGFQFSNLTKIIPDAYHGTDAANIESIRKEGFRVGTGNDCYLGDGIYFYESSKKHAIGYPRLKDKNCKKVAVFRCQISLGNCLDFHNEEHKEAMKKFARQIRFLAVDNQKFRQQHNISSPDDVTEPFLMNLAAIISHADTVRATHGFANPLFKGSKIAAENRLVIAVRTPSKILETTLDYVEE
jgi:hypothetical protein